MFHSHEVSQLTPDLINLATAVKAIDYEIKLAQQEESINDLQVMRLKKRKAELEAMVQKLRNMTVPDIIA